MKAHYEDAVKELGGKAQWHTHNGELIWTDETIERPTDIAIETKIAELKAAYDAQAYARSRKAEYPPLEDQLDHIYHNGVASWKTNVVQPVKDKYPKP